MILDTILNLIMYVWTIFISIIYLPYGCCKFIFRLIFERKNLMENGINLEMSWCIFRPILETGII